MTWRILAIALACAGASPAAAQGGLDRLMAFDTNHDGAISRAEAQDGREATFARLDTDHDGALSAEERAAARQLARRQGHADANNDGAVSRAEFMNQPFRGFEMADSDHNGIVSAAEIDAVRARFAAR